MFITICFIFLLDKIHHVGMMSYFCCSHISSANPVEGMANGCTVSGQVASTSSSPRCRYSQLHCWESGPRGSAARTTLVDARPMPKSKNWPKTPTLWCHTKTPPISDDDFPMDILNESLSFCLNLFAAFMDLFLKDVRITRLLRVRVAGALP